MQNKIELTKSVPQARWGEFFDQFSDGNRGRHISIEIISSELGDAELICPIDGDGLRPAR
jgi:hypothetical protein